MTVFVFSACGIQLGGHFLTFTCLYSSSQAILKLSQSVRGHIVTVIEVSMHLITSEASAREARQQNTFGKEN